MSDQAQNSTSEALPSKACTQEPERGGIHSEDEILRVTFIEEQISHYLLSFPPTSAHVTVPAGFHMAADESEGYEFSRNYVEIYFSSPASCLLCIIVFKSAKDFGKLSTIKKDTIDYGSKRQSFSFRSPPIYIGSARSIAKRVELAFKQKRFQSKEVSSKY